MAKKNFPRPTFGTTTSMGMSADEQYKKLLEEEREKKRIEGLKTGVDPSLIGKDFELKTDKKYVPPKDKGTSQIQQTPPAQSQLLTTKTGEIAGVQMKDGKVFLGGKESALQLLESEKRRTEVPEGAVYAQDVQAQQARSQRVQQLMQMGEQGLLSEQELNAIQQADIDWGQAGTAGLMQAAPGLLGAGAAALGAKALGVGAAATATGVGAPVGLGLAAGGLALYAASKLWSGVQANIATQQKGEIGASTQIVDKARSNMRHLRMVAEQDPTKAGEAIEGYYFWVSKVQEGERKVKMETQGNLNKYMEDGTDILSKFELFLGEQGEAYWYKERLQQALMRGTPATHEQLMQAYQEEYGGVE